MPNCTAGGVRARLRIIGEGPDRPKLAAQIREQGLTDFVDLEGALAPEVVQEAYNNADIFLHTGIVDAEGDRDGLPNVIPEAMARGQCVVTSPGGGAEEAISHDVTGLIADPADSGAMADAMTRLATDAELRAGVRVNAHRWVGENFTAAANTSKLAAAAMRD